jgi:hypothetical protein
MEAQIGVTRHLSQETARYQNVLSIDPGDTVSLVSLMHVIILRFAAMHIRWPSSNRRVSLVSPQPGQREVGVSAQDLPGLTVADKLMLPSSRRVAF